MKKTILGVVAVAAVAAPIAAVASPASAAPGVTTHHFTLNAASEDVIDLPALNSQFTKMVVTPSGSANWGADLYTSYDATGMHTNRVLTSGIWDNGGVDDGPLLLEGTQVGAVIYRVNGGAWHEVTSAPITNAEGTHVEVAYNERPGLGSHLDNSGSLELTVVRTKG